MQRVLVIGCGKLARAVIPMLSQNYVYFREVCLSGRSKEKCDTYKKKYSSDKQKIVTAYVDIRNMEKTLLMAKIYRPDLVINLAPSSLNLQVMDLCLQIGANYIDASLYMPKGSTTCDIDAEYAYDQKFREKELTAIIGCGFNPGVIDAFAQYAYVKQMDDVRTVDILDMNAGTNAHPYLMNTPMMTSLRQISSEARMWSNGQIVKTPPMSTQAKYSFPEIGKRNLYMVDHEVIDALSGEIPDATSIRYFSAFKRPFLSMVRILREVGMTSTTPVDIDGQQIAPLDFLSEVMPGRSGRDSQGKDRCRYADPWKQGRCREAVPGLYTRGSSGVLREVRRFRDRLYGGGSTRFRCGSGFAGTLEKTGHTYGSGIRSASVLKRTEKSGIHL